MKKTADEKIFNCIGYVVLLSFSILCVFPLVSILTGSVSNEASVIKYGYGLIPRAFSLDAYKIVFKNPLDILRSYAISGFLVLVGISVGLILTAMTGYVLSRRDFKYRNIFSFYIYFTSVFSGGLVPWYILMVNTLHMKNNILALILPTLLNVFYIIVMKSFMANIPFEIIESVKIDGANEIVIFTRIALPLSKAALTTIGVFIALAYWNDFFCAMLFITNENLLPLQYYLYRMVNTVEALSRVAAMTGIAVPDMPKETLKLAMTVLVVIPVMCIYPIAQKHIVGGMTLGAVKG